MHMHTQALTQLPWLCHLLVGSVSIIVPFIVIAHFHQCFFLICRCSHFGALNACLVHSRRLSHTLRNTTCGRTASLYWTDRYSHKSTSLSKQTDTFQTHTHTHIHTNTQTQWDSSNERTKRTRRRPTRAATATRRMVPLPLRTRRTTQSTTTTRRQRTVQATTTTTTM